MRSYRQHSSGFVMKFLFYSWKIPALFAVLNLFPLSALLKAESDSSANRWIEVRRDAEGARRGSSFRYVPDAGAFFLWGYMNADPDMLQEFPLMRIPEYDMVAFKPNGNKWENQLPHAWKELWSKQLPLSYHPRTYAGITGGSERTILRSATDSPWAAPRPDLNIVSDQIAYHPPSKALVYFTGGLTAAYDYEKRRWYDLRPKASPPPVLGGSMAYDPVNDEIVLFGGGHVAEPGSEGGMVGYTGTWVYEFRNRTWRQLTGRNPPPRMHTRMVLDSKNNVLVLFGGDGQSHYLADTWLYDLKTRTWRHSSASSSGKGSPPPRAGHFTVYDPQSGWVVIGGGYDSEDLTDMWAYDAAQDRWRRLVGEVPTGFYVTADIAPEKRLLLLTTNNRPPGDTMTCNLLYPVRTTYKYRFDEVTALHKDQTVRAYQALPKRSREEAMRGTAPDPARRRRSG